jgi:hypothetical protein
MTQKFFYVIPLDPNLFKHEFRIFWCSHNFAPPLFQFLIILLGKNLICIQIKSSKDFKYLLKSK